MIHPLLTSVPGLKGLYEDGLLNNVFGKGFYSELAASLKDMTIIFEGLTPCHLAI